ncbi:MAG TPA: molybdenum cofactor guanylyltransferase [Mycobacterium sp.]|nr:molybdenum cofactor guanylyltransferase [Mycobacterium sp.]
MGSDPGWLGLAGVVLTGGASRRMGRDKATLTIPGLAGRTLVEQVVFVVGQRCDPLFVMAAAEQVLPDLPARLLRDEVPGRGPLSATGRGLRAAAEAGAQRAFVCAVDMPFLTADLIDALATPAARLDADLVLPWDGRDHYLAGVYRTGLAERIDVLVAGGEHRMAALVGKVDTQRIVVSDSKPLANLNSPADLLAFS